jgi:hypothetical protein
MAVDSCIFGAICTLHCPDVRHLVPRGAANTLTQPDVWVNSEPKGGKIYLRYRIFAHTNAATG